MAVIRVYARLRGMRPNLRPATYWKFWTSVGGKPFEPFEPLRPPPENFGRDWKGPSLRSPCMCVVRLCLQYQGRGGPLQIVKGGHIRGAVGGRFG